MTARTAKPVADYHNPLPSFGQQLCAKGGRLHPDVRRAIANGGGWPGGVPIPEPLSLRAEAAEALRRFRR